MSVSVLRGNALTLPLADECVDLVVTSPPYFGLRSYTDNGQEYVGQLGTESTPTDFVAALLTATAEMVRVLTPRGSIFVNLGDKYNAYNANRGDGTLQKNAPRQRVAKGAGLDVKGVPNKSLLGIPWRYAIRCMDEMGLTLRQEIIWYKANGMPESVTDRARRSHEHWFHFTMTDRYYADREAIRADRPDSVWRTPTARLNVPDGVGARHYAMFPSVWPRKIIRLWCPPGGTVLDPFGGTGTTALAADLLGRNGISVDMSGDYSRVAAWRVADPRERARADRNPEGEA